MTSGVNWLLQGFRQSLNGRNWKSYAHQVFCRAKKQAVGKQPGRGKAAAGQLELLKDFTAFESQQAAGSRLAYAEHGVPDKNRRRGEAAADTSLPEHVASGKVAAMGQTVVMDKIETAVLDDRRGDVWHLARLGLSPD